MLADYLMFVLPVTVTGNINIDLAELCFDCFLGVPVAMISGVSRYLITASAFALFVAQFLLFEYVSFAIMMREKYSSFFTT